MNFEPQKFSIGLMDFISILLPGALLTYLLMGNPRKAEPLCGFRRMEPETCC